MRNTRFVWRPSRLLALALAGLLAVAVLAAIARWERRDERSAAAAAADPSPVFVPLISQTSRPVAPGLPLDPYAARGGEATYYAADGGGNCGFPATPGNLLVGAMNHADYAGSLTCGVYAEVAGPKGTIVVRITDQCPECQPGDIDLSAEAFALIAEPAQGRVPITWRIVSPALAGPIVYYFKDGSSQWWTAVQIRNHRNGIWRLEYLAPGGAWKSIPRVDYNYFVEPSGMGLGPYTFRVTDYYGNTLIDSGIALAPDGDVAGKAQFPRQ